MDTYQTTDVQAFLLASKLFSISITSHFPLQISQSQAYPTVEAGMALLPTQSYSEGFIAFGFLPSQKLHTPFLRHKPANAEIHE